MDIEDVVGDGDADATIDWVTHGVSRCEILGEVSPRGASGFVARTGIVNDAVVSSVMCCLTGPCNSPENLS